MPGSERRDDITKQLLDTHVMAILRGRTTRYVDKAVDTLVDEGLTCVELTFSMPDMTEVLERTVNRLTSKVAIGAGTVITAEQAKRAIQAGAQFLVSPGVCLDVLRVATSAAVPCYPAGWTPTEVLEAWHAGCTAVKLFPAGTGGPAHVRRLRAPLADIPLIPTGGVELDRVHDYLAAGGVAVGLGRALMGDALDGGSIDGLRDRARKLRSILGGW